MNLNNLFSLFTKKNNNKDTKLKSTDVIIAGRQLPNRFETIGITAADLKRDITSDIIIPETDLTGLATETYVDTEIAAIPAPDLSEAVSPAWSIDGITTHFQKGISNISNGSAVSSSFIYGELFRLDCKVKVASFDTRINALNTSYTDSEMHCAIYKLNVDTGLFELAIEQPQPFDFASVTGTTGWNKISLPAPVTLTPGVYFKVSTANSSGGSGSTSYNNNDQMSLGGYNATGNQQTGFKTFKANSSVYPTFTYLNPMPATLDPADFIPSTSGSIMKFFNTITL
jgi:hypothetical protein